MAYEFLKQRNDLFVFTTKNDKDYVVAFSFSSEYFTHTCDHCKSIYEVIVYCLNDTNPPFDAQTMETVMVIINEFSKNGSVAAVMYKCYDGDGKGCKREAHFERIFEKSDLTNFEFFSHTYEFEDDEGTVELRYNLLAARDHQNYMEIVDEFYHAPDFWISTHTYEEE